MAYAIELNPRQSARTLEQAIRHQAEVILEPRLWSDTESLLCRFHQASEKDTRSLLTSKVLTLVYSLTTPDDSIPLSSPESLDVVKLLNHFDHLVGSYCDLAIRLGDNLYLCSSDVIRVEKPAEIENQILIHLSRPDMIQVTQRRRFHRIALADSARVRLHWNRDNEGDNEGTGWLCNISPEGLACRVDAHLADRLWIGDMIQVNFSLTPMDTQRFMMDVTICSKLPAGTEGKMLVGCQFLTGAGHEYSTQSVESLRRRLSVRGLQTSRPTRGQGI